MSPSGLMALEERFQRLLGRSPRCPVPALTSKTREFLGDFQTTELLPLLALGWVTFSSGKSPTQGPAESSQSAPDVHSGRQAGLDKLCAEGRGGEGADKDASGSPHSPGALYFQSGCPTPESVPSFTLEACPAELTESARPSKGTPGLSGRLSGCWVAAMQRWQRPLRGSLLGGRCLLQVGRDAVGEVDPGLASAARCFRGSSAQRGRARPATGPLRRSGGSSSPGLCSPRPAGGAALSPRGPAQGRSSSGRLSASRQEPGGRGL